VFRPEYKFNIVNGAYVKDESQEADWWSWQPLYTINLHLPSRFELQYLIVVVSISFRGKMKPTLQGVLITYYK